MKNNPFNIEPAPTTVATEGLGDVARVVGIGIGILFISTLIGKIIEVIFGGSTGGGYSGGTYDSAESARRREEFIKRANEYNSKRWQEQRRKNREYHEQWQNRFSDRQREYDKSSGTNQSSSSNSAPLPPMLIEILKAIDPLSNSPQEMNYIKRKGVPNGCRSVGSFVEAYKKLRGIDVKLPVLHLLYTPISDSLVRAMTNATSDIKTLAKLPELLTASIKLVAEIGDISIEDIANINSKLDAFVIVNNADVKAMSSTTIAEVNDQQEFHSIKKPQSKNWMGMSDEPLDIFNNGKLLKINTNILKMIVQGTSAVGEAEIIKLYNDKTRSEFKTLDQIQTSMEKTEHDHPERLEDPKLKRVSRAIRSMGNNALFYNQLADKINHLSMMQFRIAKEAEGLISNSYSKKFASEAKSAGKRYVS